MATDLIAFTTTRYRCPHCRRSYAQKASASSHLDRCWKSPAVRTCKTCTHYEVDGGEPEVGLPGGIYCRRDVDLSSDRCATCGAEVYPDGSGDCACAWTGPRPVTNLRVRCPLWEALDA